MKLLLDNNLPASMARLLEPDYPGTTHVRHEALASADDQVIWKYALANDFTIVSKDRDFADLVVIRGHPPKVVWLRVGNSSTSEVVQIMLDHVEAISEFNLDLEAGLLVIPQSLRI